MKKDMTPWAERFRPMTIDECILPEHIKAKAHGLVASGNIPSLLFSGGAGCGKTTLARAIAHEIDADFMQINASMERGIDVIRGKITQFASTVSFSDAKKITLFDEADGLTVDAQKSLRGLFEEFSGHHTFILTCNFATKIIDPIRSRCKVIDFKVTNAEKANLATQFVKRVFSILEEEGIEFDKRAIGELVMKKFPDYRSIWNELQGYAAGGKIDAGVLLNAGEDNLNALIATLKAKKFNDMRKWVAQNSDMDVVGFLSLLYSVASEKMEAQSIPEFIVLLSDWQVGAALSANQEICTTAFLTKVLTNSDIKWK